MTEKQSWLKAKLTTLRSAVTELGLFGALKYILFRRLYTRPDQNWMLHPRQSAHPLGIRSGSSDAYVFHQIFVEREYRSLDDLTNVLFIIDCGANVGYSSSYFLSQFPQCRLIAIEPDPGNFAVLKSNLAPFGDRARPIHAGVWSQTTRLALSRDVYRSGAEWSKQVRPAEPGEGGGFDGVSIDTLLAESGADRISILKVDVEGAEAVIFAEHYHEWLDRVDAIAIELHDDSSFGPGSEVFFKAISGRGFEVSRSGELTICRRVAPAPV